VLPGPLQGALPGARQTMPDEEAPVEAAAAAPTDTEDTLSVKFVIVPEGFSHSRQLIAALSIPEVKAYIESDLRIPVANMKLVFGGQEMTAGYLRDYGLVAGQENQIELQIVYLEERVVPSTYVMPDIIQVEVHFGADIPPKLIQVPVVRAMPDKKAFLGGYRSRKTHIEYHHASSQTDPPPKNTDSFVQKYHRETQTAVLQTRSQQSVREQGTQMPTGHLGIEEGDEVLRPLPYFDSEQLAELRLEKAIDLQRYTRGWFARATAIGLLKAQDEAFAAAAAAEEAQRKEAEERHAQEIQRRMHPHTRDDFEILYNELEAWRLQETRRINSEAMEEEERLELLSQLLLKEQKLLQTIDRLRLQANEENRDKRIRLTLQLMSSPKRWQMSDGEVAQVHTPFTTRAKELMELYNGLRLPFLSIDERLDVLLHVKWTVKEFDCNLTRDIVELIDREADMLNRGRSEASLQGLRTRVANLFLQFIETPEFNPEAGRFQKVPQELIVRPNVRPIDATGGSMMR